MINEKGSFVISLDFELSWGVRDMYRLEEYKDNLIGARSAIPLILKIFDTYNVHATWATVGLLFFENYHEMMKSLPEKKPLYADELLSPYFTIQEIGSDEREDPLHYALSLIKLIASYPNQEIGTHTFSHYYCLEKGQDLTAFRNDLEAALQVAKQNDLSITSFVFPKNQVNEDYLTVCRELGITAYRGNIPHWIYQKRNGKKGEFVKKVFRFLDSYISISSHNCYSTNGTLSSIPYNLPASRFLRPSSSGLKLLESLRLHRITSSLTYAARKGLVYHLWWHPHNFGSNIQENIDFLQKIFDHYATLHMHYGMESLNMKEAAQKLARDTEFRAVNNSFKR
ncbi:MAG: polysaccharide deacetylase [Nitrospira sp.]|nr:polysaccharide deacetylase [Nitrospira sp.]